MHVKQNELNKINPHVLVVEDDDSLAGFLNELLSSSGYQVTTRSDGQAALELFCKKPDEFDLVITDQTMPRLTGVEMAQAFLELRPEQLIILCTGYSERINEFNALDMGIKKFLSKPVTPLILLNLIKELLPKSL